MRLLWSPSGPPVAPDLAEKSARLQAAHEQGRKFLVLAAETGPETVDWILASLSGPLAVVPLAPQLPVAARTRALAQLPGTWVSPENLPGPSARQPEPKDPREPWAVLFSSGSTGEPKGVALSGAALQFSAGAHVAHNGNLSWLLNLPLHHVGGFSVLTRAFFFDGTVAVGPARFDAEETLRWIRSGKVQGISLVPTTARRLLEAARPGDFSPLALSLLGGAPADPALREEAEARGLRLHLTYGLTEHSSQAATEKRPGSGLEPLPGVEMKTAEDDEILIRSPALATGIFRAGRLEALPLEDGFLPTGDLGSFVDGKLVVYGRKSELIISGGMNVFPAEVEAALREAPGVEDCAVLGWPDDEWGEVVAAAVVGDPDPETVKAYLATRIDPRKIPKRWVKLSAVPRSAAGKVLRRELKEIVEKSL